MVEALDTRDHYRITSLSRASPLAAIKATVDFPQTYSEALELANAERNRILSSVPSSTSSQADEEQGIRAVVAAKGELRETSPGNFFVHYPDRSYRAALGMVNIIRNLLSFEYRSGSQGYTIACGGCRIEVCDPVPTYLSQVRYCLDDLTLKLFASGSAYVAARGDRVHPSAGAHYDASFADSFSEVVAELNALPGYWAPVAERPRTLP